MKFGLGPYWLEATDHHRRFREMVQQALLAQECAFDSVWLGEAHFTGQGCCPHPFVPAAALAVQADALRIGVLCHLSLVHPAYVAEDAVTVDNISNGRLLMALALPWRPQEAEGYGLDPTEALARFWEGVEVLRHGWAPQPFAFQGQHYRIPARLPANRPTGDAISLTPKPAQVTIPLWVASQDGLVVEAARRRMPILGLPWQGLDELAYLFQVYKGALGDVPPDHIYALARIVWVERTSAGARRSLEEALPGLAEVWQEMLGVAAKDVGHLREAAICGDVEECIAQVRRYQEALGINYLVCYMALPGLPHRRVLQAIELWGKAVISEFRMAHFPAQIRQRFLEDAYGWRRELWPRFEEVSEP